MRKIFSLSILLVAVFTIVVEAQEDLARPTPLPTVLKREDSDQPLAYSRARHSITVTAQAGDTVKKLAERYGADPVELAKYNGLLPDSVLGSGREIRIPTDYEKPEPSKDEIFDQIKSDLDARIKAERIKRWKLVATTRSAPVSSWYFQQGK